jgi:hypothetical protein
MGGADRLTKGKRLQLVNEITEVAEQFAEFQTALYRRFDRDASGSGAAGGPIGSGKRVFQRHSWLTGLGGLPQTLCHCG